MSAVLSSIFNVDILFEHKYFLNKGFPSEKFNGSLGLSICFFDIVTIARSFVWCREDSRIQTVSESVDWIRALHCIVTLSTTITQHRFDRHLRVHKLLLNTYVGWALSWQTRLKVYVSIVSTSCYSLPCTIPLPHTLFCLSNLSCAHVFRAQTRRVDHTRETRRQPSINLDNTILIVLSTALSCWWQTIQFTCYVY